MSELDLLKPALQKTLDRDGKIDPVVLMRSDEEFYVMPYGFANYEEKESFLLMLAKIVKEKNINEVVIIHEGWMVEKRHESGDQLGQIFDGAPSRDPDRKEVLMLQRFTRTEAEIVLYPMIRSEKKVVLGEKDSTLQGSSILMSWKDKIYPTSYKSH